MNSNATARRVARLEALCRRLGQPPDEDGIETYCGQMALITHDDLNKELEVQWLRRGWQCGSTIGLTSPEKYQPNYTLFENTHCAERINVALTFSAEAIAELVGRLR